MTPHVQHMRSKRRKPGVRKNISLERIAQMLTLSDIKKLQTMKSPQRKYVARRTDHAYYLSGAAERLAKAEAARMLGAQVQAQMIRWGFV